MGSIPRPQLAVYAAAAIAVVLIGARYLHDTQSPAAPARAPAARADTAGAVRISDSTGGWAVVQVAGAVRRPGVYRLRAGARADDAVRMAGGPLPEADLSGVNLAAKAEDGRQIIVPARAPAGGAGAPAPGGPAAGAAGASGVPAPGAAVPGAAAGPPINLNTATAEQLDQLDGVGPITAQKILAYRQAHGGFRSVSELGQVPGIGDKRLAALRARVTV
ncbi:MAG: ComEA family DNA-binding protein [Solirubrobacteraceae bacterium]